MGFVIKDSDMVIPLDIPMCCPECGHDLYLCVRQDDEIIICLECEYQHDVSDGYEDCIL